MDVENLRASAAELAIEVDGSACGGVRILPSGRIRWVVWLGRSVVMLSCLHQVHVPPCARALMRYSLPPLPPPQLQRTARDGPRPTALPSHLGRPELLGALLVRQAGDTALHASPYRGGAKCNLCLSEAYRILTCKYKLINRHSEGVIRCLHAAKKTFRNYITR